MAGDAERSSAGCTDCGGGPVRCSGLPGACQPSVAAAKERTANAVCRNPCIRRCSCLRFRIFRTCEGDKSLQSTCRKRSLHVVHISTLSRQKSSLTNGDIVPLAGLRWTPPSTPEHGPRSSGRVRAAAPRPRLIRASRRLNHRQEALRSAADCAGAQPRVLSGLGVGCGCSTRGSL